MLGLHVREIGDIQAALQRHPEMKVLKSYELRARAALLDTAPVWERLRVLVETGGPAAKDVPLVMRQVAMELRAHGDEPGAMRALAMVRQWYANRPASDTATVSHQSGIARTAFLQDDRVTARRIYTALNKRIRDCVDCLGALGVLAARDGNREVVAHIDAELSRTTKPYLFGRHLLWRARMQAAIGNVQRARTLLSAAREEGLELDVLTHADADLRSVPALFTSLQTTRNQCPSSSRHCAPA